MVVTQEVWDKAQDALSAALLYARRYGPKRQSAELVAQLKRALWPYQPDVFVFDRRLFPSIKSPNDLRGILSDGELQVFRMYGQGRSVVEIARYRNDVSVKTISTQLMRVRSKLHIETLAELRVVGALLFSGFVEEGQEGER
jgi:DNA-binding NarL/FixJ family response regulator